MSDLINTAGLIEGTLCVCVCVCVSVCVSVCVCACMCVCMCDAWQFVWMFFFLENSIQTFTAGFSHLTMQISPPPPPQQPSSTTTQKRGKIQQCIFPYISIKTEIGGRRDYAHNLSGSYEMSLTEYCVKTLLHGFVHSLCDGVTHAYI